MATLSSTVFDLASRISTPLALAGFALATLFFIFRQLLAKNIFPRLSRAIGGALLRQIVDRLFILALVAMILGFAGYIVVNRGHTQSEPRAPAAASAQIVLEKLYAGDWAQVYEAFSPAFRAQLPFGAFAADAQMTMSQFSSPPKYRHLQSKQIIAGQLFFTFESEFDARSRVREVVTYVNADGSWALWRFDLLPSDWPLPGSMKPLADSSAGSLIDKVMRLPLMERREILSNDVVNHWIALPGWSGVVVATVSQKGERTCDVQLQEESSRASIVARDLLDGCALGQNQRLTLVGRVDTVTALGVEISGVRFWRRI